MSNDYSRTQDRDRARYGANDEMYSDQYGRGASGGRPEDPDYRGREARPNWGNRPGPYGNTAYGQEGWQGQRDDEMYQQQGRYAGSPSREDDWRGRPDYATGYSGGNYAQTGRQDQYIGTNYSEQDPRRSDVPREQYTDQNRYGAAYSSAPGTAARPGMREPWQIPGPYTGRGPRGYTRSDERIREDINDRLTQHGQVDASDIAVVMNSGVATLTGFVATRDQKRQAEDVVESVVGVQDVNNQLKVRQGVLGQIKDALIPGSQDPQTNQAPTTH